MKPILALLPAALAFLLPAPAFADDGASAAAETVRSVTVFGNDACPPSTASEIVVCARRPESDRYRIPKALRHKKPRDSDGAWGNTALMLDEIGRTQMTPNSCSPNGANGQSGCTMKYLHQWYAERQQKKAEDAQVDADAQVVGDETTPP